MNILGRLPFARIIFADAEFHSRPGELVTPICYVAKDHRTGQVWRVGMGEFGVAAPHPTDRQTVLISYSIAAEMSVFEKCRWPRPSRAIDLFAEHRVNINGLSCRDLGFPPDAKEFTLWSARGAMVCHGLDPTSSILKQDLYELTIERGPPYSRAELKQIMSACERDVDDLIKLAERMFPRIFQRQHGLVHALNRGGSGIGMAASEAAGVPVDTPRLRRLREHWDGIRDLLASDTDRKYGIFDGHGIDQGKFSAFLNKHRIAWPRTPKTGALCTDKDTFKDMARGAHHALLNPLREALSTLGQMRLNDLRVGSDGRNRAALKPFWAKTGRCQPSSSHYIFGNATWYRGLIKPGKGRAILYADWRCQEIGIEAVLSQDPAMLEDLASVDFYISFAIRAGRLPPDATKDTHELERGPFKTVALGVGYGMQKKSLSERLAITSPEARELLRLHRASYPKFWRWNDDVVHYGTLRSKLWTTYGWELNITADTKIKTVRNFLMQANAAEMLRIACRYFVERGGFDKGFLLAGPVHDALLVECPADALDEAEEFTVGVMQAASRAVLGGFTLGVDVKRWRHPERFMDVKRGLPTWNKIMGYLKRMEAVEKSAHSFDRRIKNPQGGGFLHADRIRNRPPVTSISLSFFPISYL